MGRHAGITAEQSRARILQATIDLVATRGLAATSMADLASEIGMTQGVLYWHFRSKEDLIIATIDELEKRLALDFASFGADLGAVKDKRSLSRTLVHRVCELAETKPNHFAFIGVVAAESPKRNPRLEEGLRNAFRRVGSLVEMFLAAPARSAPRGERAAARAQLFLGIFLGGIMHQRLFREDIPIGRARPELVELLHAALLAPPAQVARSARRAPAPKRRASRGRT